MQMVDITYRNGNGNIVTDAMSATDGLATFLSQGDSASLVSLSEAYEMDENATKVEAKAARKRREVKAREAVRVYESVQIVKV